MKNIGTFNILRERLNHDIQPYLDTNLFNELKSADNEDVVIFLRMRVKGRTTEQLEVDAGGYVDMSNIPTKTKQRISSYLAAMAALC